MREAGVLHPRAVVHEPAESVLHEEVVEPLQVVVAELVDDDQHREPRRAGWSVRRRLPGGGCLLSLRLLRLRLLSLRQRAAFPEQGSIGIARLRGGREDQQQRQDQTRSDVSGYGHDRPFQVSDAFVTGAFATLAFVTGAFVSDALVTLAFVTGALVSDAPQVFFYEILLSFPTDTLRHDDYRRNTQRSSHLPVAWTAGVAGIVKLIELKDTHCLKIVPNREMWYKGIRNLYLPLFHLIQDLVYNPGSLPFSMCSQLPTFVVTLSQNQAVYSIICCVKQGNQSKILQKLAHRFG